MSGKPKRVAKKNPAETKTQPVEDQELEEMDADELALIFPSTPYQANLPKYGEN